ncbi:MAG: uroporphyrinogen decarboxylase family protein [Chloroflexota bacterium]|nr:uroporphyrinogen decarboxylase family protein [Chloroflexota bacterium]
MAGYTARELVEAAFKGEKPDRVPFTTAMLYHQGFAQKLGFTVAELLLDPEKALHALTLIEKTFPSDMFMHVPGDPYSPEAMAAYRQATKGSGAPIEYPLADKSALERMPFRDPRQSSAYSRFLAMCRRVREIYPDRWVATTIPGPWTATLEMRQPETALYDTRDDPGFLHRAMHFNTEYAKARGLAVAETGVNVIVGDPSSSCGLISPRVYREFVRPYHEALFRHLREKRQGAVKFGLHICGYTDPILPDLAALPLDWIEMDAPSNLARMLELCQGGVVVRGNVPGEVLATGTPQQVAEAVRRCLETARGYPRYILSPGCTMANAAPMENIQAFWEAASQFGRA